MKLFALVCLTLFLATSAATAADPPRFELKDGDRVAFIGNTFVEREQVDCYIETALTSRYPDRNITFRNLGYSGDTVTGEARGLCSGWSQFEAPDKAFERLRKLVAEYKPTVLLINYGMTESFLGPEKLPEFTANYNKMLDALIAAAGTSPRVVLMSPNYHEDLGRPLPDPAEHNKSLKLYSKAIEEVAAKRGGFFIDLFWMTKSAPARLTSNGIHLTPYGYWYIAGMIEVWFSGQAVLGWSATLDLTVTPPKIKEAWHVKLSDVKLTNGTLEFTALGDHLPCIPMAPALPPAAGPQPNGLFVSTLPPGQHPLKVGNRVCAEVENEKAEPHATGFIEEGPDFDQVEELRKLIVAKNFDYFNYQRPDNDSYILAFRKREQGRNAVEIPQFLPFVEEKEKQIAVLRVPKPVTYTLEKVK
jgi:lysophospholipase L1-like esterase